MNEYAITNKNTSTTNIAHLSDTLKDKPSNNIIQFPNANTANKPSVKTNRKQTNQYQSKTVQPMKDKEDIERAKQYFQNSHTRYNSINLRNYCLFVLGINCAKRIGDLLDLRISDVIDNNGAIKFKIYIREEKTGKKGLIVLFDEVQNAIVDYLNSLEEINSDDYLFSSRKANKEGEYKLDTRSAWRIMNEMSKALELDYNVGTHTMRKTFAYNALQNATSQYEIAKVSQSLNHSSEKITRMYLGLDEEEMIEFYRKNQL